MILKLNFSCRLFNIISPLRLFLLPEFGEKPHCDVGGVLKKTGGEACGFSSGFL